MKTVRARLTLFTVLIVAAILAAMGLFVRFNVQANLIDEIDRQLQTDVSSVETGPFKEAEALSKPLPPEGNHTFGKNQLVIRHPAVRGQETMMQVLRSNRGDVRLEAKWNAPRLIPATDMPHSEGLIAAEDPVGLKLAADDPGLHDFTLSGEPARSLTSPVRQDGRLVAYVQATRPLGPIRRQMADLDRALATSIPVAVLLAALGGGLVVRSSMRPLRKMTESARRLDRDLSSARLPVEGADEFAALATTINAAFDQTSAAFVEQRKAIQQLERFTGDAGHELRTPLATVKTNSSYLLHVAEVAPEHRPALDLIDRSADRMTKLIGDLLLLARQDGGRATLHPVAVDVSILVRDAIDSLPVKADIRVGIRCDAEVVCIDSDAVERVTVNLVSNALRYAKSEVEVKVSRRENLLLIEVSDDGPGIAPTDVLRLGERFFRPDEARSRHEGGAGLGLAIARSLTEGHGGDLTIQSQLGEGTTTRASFRIVHD